MLKPKRSTIIVFLGPAVLLYLAVFLYPTLRTLAMSFFAVVGVSDRIGTWTFNYFANYIYVFNQPLFVRALQNIGRIWFFGGLGVMFLALIFAVALTQNLKGTKFFRAAIYLPNVISAVAMGTMWLQYVYNVEWGLLIGILRTLGLVEAGAVIHWTGPGARFWSMLVAYSFGMVGYHMLIFISGIEQIPKDYHEAALIEGASVVKRFFLVTLPFIRGVLRTNIVMWTVFTVGFFIWGELFSPVNISNDTVAPMNYVYHLVFGGRTPGAVARNAGAGAAIGVIMMLSIIVVFIATRFITAKDDAEV